MGPASTGPGERFGALTALALRTGASLWVDGTWSTPDRPGAPLVVVDTQPGKRCRPVPGPGRRALVAVAPTAPLLRPDPTDPLVAVTSLDAAGTGPLEGLRLALVDAGPAPAAGTAVVTAEGEAVVVADGDLTVVGCTEVLADDLLAAADNARAVVRCLLGADHPDRVAEVHAWRSCRTVTHASPPSVGVPEGWGLDVPPPGTPLGAEAVARTIRRNLRRLPAEVHDALLDFADEGHPAGALLLSGLPVGAVPPTPPTPATPAGKDLVSETVLLTVGRLLGQPVGYEPEHGGDLVQNLVPTPDGVTRQVSTSSAVTLAWHTEAAFHRHRPRFLLLLCLRGDPAARTTLCSIREVAPALTSRARRVLAEPRFRTAADESYVGARTDRLGTPVPVLSGDPAAPQLRFDADLMVGTDPEARAALDELTALVGTAHTSVALAAGDLLVVDNTVAVHGRSPFPARFDGTDRWVQRAFVVADLAPSAAERDGRVVRTRFAA